MVNFIKKMAQNIVEILKILKNKDMEFTKSEIKIIY